LSACAGLDRPYRQDVAVPVTAAPTSAWSGNVSWPTYDDEVKSWFWMMLGVWGRLDGPARRVDLLGGGLLLVGWCLAPVSGPT